MTFVVYAHFDAAGAPLYVGSTCRLKIRQSHHKHHAPWWPLSHSVRVTPCADEKIARDHEAREIGRLRPKFNRMHNPDRGFRQVVHKPADHPPKWMYEVDQMTRRHIATWPAKDRAFMCNANWRSKGFPGFDAPSDEEPSGD